MTFMTRLVLDVLHEYLGAFERFMDFIALDILRFLNLSLFFL